MLSVFLKMCRQLFLFVCVVVCLFSSSYPEPSKKMHHSPGSLQADTVGKINDDHRICEANWNLWEYWDSPSETESADQYNLWHTEFRPTPGLPGSLPFSAHGQMLSVEIMLGTKGEKKNVMVHPSIYPFISAYPRRTVVAADLGWCSRHFLATVSGSSWGPRGTAR